MNQHSMLVNRVLIELGSKKEFMIWKNATGATKNECGRYVRYGLKGAPDIIGVKKGGKFIALEIKTGAAVQSPAQIKFQKRFEELGGLYIVVRDMDDLDQIL